MDNKEEVKIQLVTLKQKVPFDFIVAGHALSKIRDEFGMKNMVEFAQSVGIRSRAAKYYANLSDKFFDYEDRDRLIHIGWTKLKTIVQHLEKYDLDYLLSRAEKLSENNLKAGLTGQPNVKHVWNLNFSLEQMRVVDPTFVKFGGKKKSGEWLKSKEDTLVEICRLAMETLKGDMN